MASAGATTARIRSVPALTLRAGVHADPASTVGLGIRSAGQRWSWARPSPRPIPSRFDSMDTRRATRRLCNSWRSYKTAESSTEHPLTIRRKPSRAHRSWNRHSTTKGSSYQPYSHLECSWPRCPSTRMQNDRCSAFKCIILRLPTRELWSHGGPS